MRSIQSLITLAVVLLTTGCGPKRESVQTTSPVVAAMNRGVGLMGQYEYDAAVKAFEEALKADPALDDVKVNLAIARFNRAHKEDRDLEQAGELLDGVLKRHADNVRAWYFRGIVFQHVGQAEAAIPCFENVVRLRPDNGVAWYLLGLCKQRIGQKAESEFLKAIELRPYLGSAYYKLWQMLQSEGQMEKAQPFFDKFNQLRENPLNEVIELPQYNYMGDLALAQPLPMRNAPPITQSTYTSQAVQILFKTHESAIHSATASSQTPKSTHPLALSGAAIADFNRDGALDMILPYSSSDGAGRLIILLGQTKGGFVEATTGSGLESVQDAVTCALGDFDNDEIVDLFVAAKSGNYLFRGKGDGTFIDVTRQSGVGGQPLGTRSALFLDADHDGDLDIFVCNATPTGNQLWNNNADGVFTNIAVSAGVNCAGSTSVMVLPGDLDGDRDTDLVVLRESQPAKVFVNDLLGKYHEVDCGASIQGDIGGVLQDLNGDGRLDILAMGGNPARLRFFFGEGQAHFHENIAFTQCADAAASWGPLRGFRIVDLDLDGDLDIAVFSTDAHVLFNDGAGRFVLQTQFWKPSSPNALAGAELCDLNGDYVADLLRIERGTTNQVTLLPGKLAPPSTALSIAPTGMRGRDKRTRSPASGFGVALTVRAGLREQSRVVTGQLGGFNQSELPIVLGLGGVRQADYVHFLWPDGVAQVEMQMASGQAHKIGELQRKTSSCPVLFSWNGTRFECVTDFAGVGGLGYFLAPGEYAQPQALEHVKIEPEQLRPLNGSYELRITEPMEETAYIDRLELLAIDHPAGWSVFPDERLAVSGPPPTHELLVVDKPIFPLRALAPMGRDCTERLTRIDRVYAYEPELDRRFFGFCRPHALELDFGGQLADIVSTQRLFLFISGYIEYPYSQTAYAASQASVGWEPIRIERLTPDGRWQTIVPDAGAFGGMARTMTVDLTGLISGPACRLRLTSNLEIYYDQVFLARDVGPERVNIYGLGVAAAELRHAGFAREFSPDGRMPLIYDYSQSDATAPFHVLRGAYTRYGTVKELLKDFDDQYVMVGPGDEIALCFDESKLPAPVAGVTRSFVLVSHAYCKDMDLYTATPQTLEPLPFRGMSRYPYPATEHYPDTKEHREYKSTYNTRIIQ
jgi:tetratricopeptide (TPR) repeat protein